jgi:hypothetical protein
MRYGESLTDVLIGTVQGRGLVQVLVLAAAAWATREGRGRRVLNEDYLVHTTPVHSVTAPRLIVQLHCNTAQFGGQGEGGVGGGGGTGQGS